MAVMVVTATHLARLWVEAEDVPKVSRAELLVAGLVELMLMVVDLMGIVQMERVMAEARA